MVFHFNIPKYFAMRYHLEAWLGKIWSKFMDFLHVPNIINVNIWNEDTLWHWLPIQGNLSNHKETRTIKVTPSMCNIFQRLRSEFMKRAKREFLKRKMFFDDLGLTKTKGNSLNFWRLKYFFKEFSQIHMVKCFVITAWNMRRSQPMNVRYHTCTCKNSLVELFCPKFKLEAFFLAIIHKTQNVSGQLKFIHTFWPNWLLS